MSGREQSSSSGLRKLSTVELRVFGHAPRSTSCSPPTGPENGRWLQRAIHHIKTERAGVVHTGDGLLASLVELDISSAFRHMHAYEEVARFSGNSGPTQLHELEYTGDLRVQR